MQRGISYKSMTMFLLLSVLLSVSLRSHRHVLFPLIPSVYGGNLDGKKTASCSHIFMTHA